MIRKTFFTLICAVLLTACAGTSQPSTEITLEETDFAYGPASITVPLGQPITLTIKNNGKVEHDFVIQKINVTDLIAESGGMSMEHQMGREDYDLHVSTLAGNTSILKFTPMEAGAYEIFCTVEAIKKQA